MHNNNFEKGQSLVEVVVALSIAVLIVIAFTNATLVAVRDAQFAKNQNQATRIAQRSLELIRAVRDQDNEVDSGTWNSLWGSSSLNSGKCYILNETDATLTSATNCNDTSDQQIDSVFKRKIRLTNSPSTPGKIDVYVKVYWTDGRGTHASETTTLLTNWQ